MADDIGYPAAALGILIESLGIPFPGETTVLAVAAYAATGRLWLPGVIMCAFAGSVTGGDLGYLAGRIGGRPLLERILGLFRISPGHLNHTETFFARHGDKAVFFARFVIGARTWGALLAGTARMPFWRFQIWSLLGSLVWAIVISLLGYFLGNNWPLLERIIKVIGLGGLAVVIIIGLTAYVVYRRRISRI